MKQNNPERIVLLDSNAIVHRAFHALPPLTSPTGEPTNAVYGFVSILLKIIAELKPTHMLAAFDLAAPTFRHKAFAGYKATRGKAPDELYLQFPPIKKILGMLSVPIYEKEGYEADDIIGTAVKFFEKKNPNAEILIVTGDLDTLQLISPKTKVYTMRKGLSDTVIYNENAFRERFGFSPEHMIDYKGLRGDPSDNIPGIRGIGEKTAMALVQQFGTIEDIYKNISKVKPDGVRKKLEESKEEALFSKELSTINTSSPVSIDLKSATWRNDIKENKDLRSLFQSLGFFSLLKRLDMVSGGEHKEVEKKPAVVLKEKSWKDVSKDMIRGLVGEIEKEKVFAAGIFHGEGLFQQSGAAMHISTGDALWVLKDEELSDPRILELFESPAIEKVLFDSRPIASYLRKKGKFLRGVRMDIVLAEYIIAAHEKIGDAKTIITKELSRRAERSEDIIHYAFDIEKKLQKKLSVGKLLSVLSTIEIPLVPFLTEMEFFGILLDSDLMKKLAGSVDAKIKKLTDSIYKLAGEEFNISSPQQVSKILFEKLDLLGKGMRKTKGGAQSTSASELVKLQGKHPIIDPILAYRELQKLKTTYIDVLPTLVSPDDKRVHTTFNQTVTATGRLSSSNPNLQNIPTRTDLGKEIRKAFIPERGFSFLAFDYSQIELRLAAHMSNDEKMIQAFRENKDIHTMTAAEVNGVPFEKVTSEMRREAKTLNFGVLYGMGFRAFAESSGISKERAKEFIQAYYRDFSGVRSYIESTKIKAARDGYVETLFGRRRYVPELKSPFGQVRAEGERMAVNMPIQGTAADMMKLAMIRIWESIILKQKEIEVRPILQIHDELIFEVKNGMRKKIEPLIKDIMENVIELSVPIVVDVEAGESWGDLH